MNNDKVDECKCERCLQPIEDSSDVQSLGDYDIICESCIESFDECSGYNCSEIGSGFTMSSHGDHYCGSCENDLTECYECEELIELVYTSQQLQVMRTMIGSLMRCVKSATKGAEELNT